MLAEDELPAVQHHRSRSRIGVCPAVAQSPDTYGIPHLARVFSTSTMEGQGNRGEVFEAMLQGGQPGAAGWRMTTRCP